MNEVNLGDQRVPPPTIQEIMTPNFLAVAPDCLLSGAIQLMRERKESCVMVVENGEARGIVTESDAVGLLSESFNGVNWNNLPVDHVMTSPVVSVCQDLNLLEAILVAKGGRIRHIAITDEGGRRLVGVLKQTEIVQALAEYCRIEGLW